MQEQFLELFSTGETTAVVHTSQQPFTSEANGSSDVNIEVVLLDDIEEEIDNSKDEEKFHAEEGGYLVISESKDISTDTDSSSGDELIR